MAITSSLTTSSNPTLKQFTEKGHYGGGSPVEAKQATLSGVVHRTGVLVGIAALAGGAAYSFLPLVGSIMIVSCIAAMIVTVGVGFILAGSPQKAPFLAPIYAIVEGGFLGLLTKLLDYALASMAVDVSADAAGGAGVVFTSGTLALPAFIITMACVVTMLTLYSLRIIQPTARFKAVVFTLVGAVMLAYMAMFVLSFFGVSIPYLSLGSALEGGNAALIGIGLNLFILGLASLMLIIDFGMVEQVINQGHPRYMEWYCGFALLVTLAWIYYEAVKLAFRLAILMNRRD